MPVSLRPVTRDNFRQVVGLAVGPEQRSYVADNVRSLAEAYLEPLAWPRAIYADDEPVGFLMVHMNDEKREYFLWRLMIADGHQGRGYGRDALALLADELRTRGGTELKSSYEPGDHSPRGFYLGLGFEESGEVYEGEVVIRLPL
jgi:diamine N-acetyltransferase